MEMEDKSRHDKGKLVINKYRPLYPRVALMWHLLVKLYGYTVGKSAINMVGSFTGHITDTQLFTLPRKFPSSHWISSVKIKCTACSSLEVIAR